MGDFEQGRDPAGRRAAAPAGQPDHADEPRPHAAAALLVPAARREGGGRPDRRRPRQRRHAPGSSTATRPTSPAGCSVADWQCVRVDVLRLSRHADHRRRRPQAYQAAGFEIALHLQHRTAPNFTPALARRRLGRRSCRVRATTGPAWPRRGPTARTASPGATGRASRRSSSSTASGSTRTTTTGPAAWVQDRPGHVHRLGLPDALRRRRRLADRRLPGGDADHRRVGASTSPRTSRRCSTARWAPTATTASSPPTCTPTTPTTRAPTRSSPRRRRAACRSSRPRRCSTGSTAATARRSADLELRRRPAALQRRTPAPARAASRR